VREGRVCVRDVVALETGETGQFASEKGMFALQTGVGVLETGGIRNG